jgi:hypothetical protein
MTHLCFRIYLTWTTSNSSLKWCSIHSFSGVSSLTTSQWPVFRPNLIQAIQSLVALGVFRPPRYLWITTRPLCSNLPHWLCRPPNSYKHHPSTSPSSTSIHPTAPLLSTQPLVAPSSRQHPQPPSTISSSSSNSSRVTRIPTKLSCSPFSPN